MVKFKNLARDINATPLQYRVWITDGYLDDTGEQYTGYRAGTNDFIDFSHRIIPDDAILDFSFPDALSWAEADEVLPCTMEASSLAILNGYVYLFGGRGTNKILRAPCGDPGRWVDTGATLPEEQLYGSHCAVLDDGYIYLFGGNNGTATKNIYSASVTDPLTWTNHGELLPEPRSFGTLLIYNDNIYLFGGYSINNVESTIFTSTFASPLNWVNSSNSLPEPIYASQGILVGNNFYLLGGNTSDHNPTNNVYGSSVSSINFSIVSSLPFQCSYGQVYFIGNDIYYATPTAHDPDGYGYQYTSKTRILKSSKANPLFWSDTWRTLPLEVSMSQIAIIYDRLFAFGGAGCSAIVACEPQYSFSFTKDEVTNYGLITRTLFQAAVGYSDKFDVLGMPPWKTDYNG